MEVWIRRRVQLTVCWTSHPWTLCAIIQFIITQTSYHIVNKYIGDFHQSKSSHSHPHNSAVRLTITEFLYFYLKNQRTSVICGYQKVLNCCLVQDACIRQRLIAACLGDLFGEQCMRQCQWLIQQHSYRVHPLFCPSMLPAHDFFATRPVIRIKQWTQGFTSSSDLT